MWAPAWRHATARPANVDSGLRPDALYLYGKTRFPAAKWIPRRFETLWPQAFLFARHRAKK
jgi:hypothetical protein